MEGNAPAFANQPSITERMQKIRLRIYQEEISGFPVRDTETLLVQVKAGQKTNGRETQKLSASPWQRAEWKDFDNWHNCPL